MYTPNVRRWVRRILDDDRKAMGHIYPCFYSFARAPRPVWWHDDIALPLWGKVFGVHENIPGHRLGSIVIAENGIALLGADDSATWVHYAEIEQIGSHLLQKEPVPSTSLHIWTKAGEHIELPFESEPGGAFGFVQFISGAKWEHNRAGKP